MKEKLEAEFQKMLSAAYGSTQISKDQQTDIKLAFFGGMMICLKETFNFKTLEDVKTLQETISEIFHETNNNR